MKPCSKNRKRIAWLALDALEAHEAAALREHLALCAGCRHYWEEISTVAEKFASAPPESEIEPSESFHRRLAAKLQAVEGGSLSGDLEVYFRGTLRHWRLAVPAAVAAVVTLVFIDSWRHPAASLPPSPPAQAGSPNVSADLAPTIANYRMAASQSLEKLDELLTEQGNQKLPPAPVYTASGVILANRSF